MQKRLGDTPELQAALEAVTSAYVSDARWPPLPTSPGRFNVREALDDLKKANALLGSAMDKAGIGAKRALYSAPLMNTEIALVEKTLMDQSYFGE